MHIPQQKISNNIPGSYHMIETQAFFGVSRALSFSTLYANIHLDSNSPHSNPACYLFLSYDILRIPLNCLSDCGFAWSFKYYA